MQKICTALAGVLYAYEIPLPAIACEDDCSASTTPGTEEEKGLCTDCSVESNNPCSVNQGTNCQTATPNCNNILSGEELEEKEGKSSRTNSENSSEEGENRLKVQEDWFADGKKNKKKASSSPIKRLSPKLRKRLSPKFGGGFNFTLRKSSSSNSSTEMTEGTYNSNSDSGISLSVENSPNRQKLSVAGNTDNASRNSSITSTPSSGPSPYLGYCFSGFVVAMHRKTVSGFFSFLVSMLRVNSGKNDNFLKVMEETGDFAMVKQCYFLVKSSSRLGIFFSGCHKVS